VVVVVAPGNPPSAEPSAVIALPAVSVHRRGAYISTWDHTMDHHPAQSRPVSIEILVMPLELMA
jgi:hypothetical protein